MPLYVVPLSVEDSALLTLGEFDELRKRDRVLFERPDHPLLERLLAEGIPAGPFDDEPEAGDDSWALVAEPSSPRVIALARAGAMVAAGPASPPDDLTAAHAAPILRRGAAALADVIAIMARLRSDDGCPWDKEQTHSSLVPHLLEEAYEVIDSIERGEVGDELAEELGDVLLQVAFHSRLAEQAGSFDVARVAAGLVAKLVHRHPHVFGDVTVGTAHEVVANWEELKAKEKSERSGPFDDIPAALPALVSAYKTVKRAAPLGFEADESAARKNLATALEADDDVGSALFWLVVLARARGIDPEGALRGAVARFRDSL
jgi:XTP/dITP diphosphohydrolase